MMKDRFFSHFGFVQAALLGSLVLIGGMTEVFAYLISATLAALLIVTVIRNRRFRFRWNPVTVAVLGIPLFYLISAFYAVDGGMAFLGFLKYASVGLFLLLVLQYDRAAEDTTALLPWFALALGAASLALTLIPGSPFITSGRLAGFFEYANTFAMFLLIGELAALGKEKLRLSDIIVCVLLLGLIIATGSRAVFALAAASNIAMLFTKKNARVRIMTGIAVGILLAVVAVLYFLRGQSEFLNRLFSFSVTDSTFAGRMLYASDSLKLIGSHPFGLGYMGYSYLEPGIQTGVYSVKNVHNGVLQLMLDIGWIPAAGFVGAVIWSLFSKRLDAARKIILLTFFLHTLFDFDLSFPAMFFLMILLMDTEAGKEKKIAKNTALLIGALGLLELYFAVHAGLWYLNLNSAADTMYPYNTENQVAMIRQSDDIREQKKIADKIEKNNDSILIVDSVNAAYAYAQGDIEEFIRCENRVLEKAPLVYDEYENYAYKLVQAIDAFLSANDENSARICAGELLQLNEKLLRSEDRISPLGGMIEDKMRTTFPQGIREVMEQLQNN